MKVNTEQLGVLLRESGYRFDFVASELGITTSTLWNIRQTGKLPRQGIIRDHVISKLAGLLRVDPEVFLIQNEAA
jgi:hypothetical protein